jgi:hypothetical protein
MSTQPRVLPGVEMNDDLIKAIAGSVDAEQIKAAILAEAEKQGATADAAAAEKAAQEQAAANAKAAEAAAAGFERTVIIGGREFKFEAATELELERSINNAYAVAYALQPAEQDIHAAAPEPVPTAEEVAAKAAAEAEAKAELELKFKRGDITAAEYIEQSGAVDSYLATKGISVDRLKSVVESNDAVKEQQSWAEATEAFKTGPGADWPGGDKNLHRIGLYIQALDLMNADDKVAALAQAYNAMKEANDVEPFTPAASTTQDAAAQAAAKAAADKATADAAAAAARTAATVRTAASAMPAASSLWGASSGVGAGASSGAQPTKGADQIAVPANVSPEEIMDAWKKATLAAGKNPDDAFREQYGARR